jgi:hypothetical protein
VIELAWGAQAEVCLDLAITGGLSSGVGLSASIDACGRTYGGAPALMQFGTGAVGPDGVVDSRQAFLDPTVLGYDPASAGSRPNLADVMSLASYVEGDATDATCVKASVSGAAPVPRIDFKAAITLCAWVSSRTETTVTLSHPDGDWEMAQLRLTDGSSVGKGVTQQEYYGNARGFRVFAKNGIDGSFGISVRALDGCGS